MRRLVKYLKYTYLRYVFEMLDVYFVLYESLTTTKLAEEYKNRKQKAQLA